MSLTAEIRREMYRQMVRSRAFDHSVIGFSRSLEQAILPLAGRIADAARTAGKGAA